MNKSFISRQNGIKRSVISSLICALLVGVALVHPTQSVHAATTETYTQIFQNPTTTLEGKSVQTDLYFSKIDYWDVKKATLSLNFQISQLAARQSSDITLALNGTKFLSFRPSKASGLQTKQVDLPLKLLQGINHLTIYGQVLNDSHGELPQTPANWLTIYNGANVNFQYDLNEATPSVKSFYNHFTGMDTVANHRSAIVVPDKATDAELTAALYALGGVARVITTTDAKIPLLAQGDNKLNDVDYQLVVAKYATLPDELRKQVKLADNQAVLQNVTRGNKHFLVVTAKTDVLLKKAAQFVANQELMSQTVASREVVDQKTQVFTSVLQYQGKYQLTQTDTTLTGAGHHSATYFVSLPVDRTNADGSTVDVHFRYAKNLNFKNALATVTVDGQKVGSKRLSEAKADGDILTVKLPRHRSLSNTFTISVDMDLEMAEDSDNQQTPWAVIGHESTANIRSTTRKELLFNNFPSTFIKNQTYRDMLIVRPKQMTNSDMATLTNIGNLFGNYAQSNTGDLRVTSEQPRREILNTASVVAFGTPKQNALIHELNDKLYFQFTKDQRGFLSNEKLSIERAYGQTIGTAQLLRSPYNDKHALLVVTGGTPEATLLGSSQISTQAEISQYAGDAIVVDPDNQHYSYRFKKVADVTAHQTAGQVVSSNRKILSYLAVAFMMVGILLLAVFLLVRKHAKGDAQHEES